jgi:tetratricopeptide (TPR) repeat protein
LAVLAVVLIFLFGNADRKMGSGFSQLPEADQNRVKRILQAADTLYQDHKLLLPPGNNAWEKYREVFTIHKNNRVAQERLALIRNDLLVQIKTPGDYAAAKSLLQRGLECFPADSALLALDRRLDLQRLEQQAHAHISKQRFVSPSGENAYEVCQKMLALDPANQAAQDILKTIANWFLQEGERLVGAGQSIKAAEIYRQALQFFPRNAEFSKRRQELVGAVAIDKTLAGAKSAFDRKDWKNAWNKTVEILNAAPAEQSALSCKIKLRTA